MYITNLNTVFCIMLKNYLFCGIILKRKIYYVHLFMNAEVDITREFNSKLNVKVKYKI